MAFNPNAAVWVPGKGLVVPEPQPAAEKPAEKPAAKVIVLGGDGKEKKEKKDDAAKASWEDDAEDEPKEKPKKSKKAEEVSDSKLLDEAMREGVLNVGAPVEAEDDDLDANAAPETAPLNTGYETTELKLEGDDEEDDEDFAAPVAISGTLRRHVNIVFIGHVDAGKSTISGHLMYLTGMIDDRTLQKYEQKAKGLSRESWVFAWALDTTDQERAKGKTEECGRANFETANKRFTILDAPGHKSFIPHMIGGASQADIAILVISARKGEFETGFDRGGQTREHAMLAKTSGVKRLVVVINKMDDITVEWDKERYDECVKQLTPYLKTCGFNPKKDISFLPVSGLQGYNLKNRLDPAMCDWYKGPSLLQLLDELKPPEQLYDVPLRMPIHEKFRDMGTVVLGKLESGSIKRGDQLMVMPNQVKVEVQSIMIEEYDLEAGEPGDNLKIKLRGIEEEDVKPGFVLSHPTNLVHCVTRFDVKLIVLEHKSIICAGYSAILHIHACQEEVYIEELLATLDKKGEVIKKRPKFIKSGMTARVRFRVNNPICVEPFKDFPQLGRFMIRDEGKTVGVGVVLKLKKRKELED